MSRLPFGPPLAPMLGKLVHELPEAPGMLYEPKWDGFRALAFAGDEVVVQSRQGKDLSRYFPEIVEMLRASCTERGMVLDGEIIVVAERGLDFASLMQRLHPSASRVARLRVETPAVFVAFDLLADGEEDLRERPFAERRARLVARLARESSPHLVVTPQTPSPERAARWFAAEGGGAS